MNNLEKKDTAPNPMLLMMNEMLENFMTKSPKQGFYEDSLLKGFFHNWKMRQLEISSERQNAIAKYNAETVAHNAAKIQTAVLLQTETNDKQKEAEHRDFMRRAAENEVVLKNRILFYEAESAELQFKREKEDYDDEKAKKAKSRES